MKFNIRKIWSVHFLIFAFGILFLLFKTPSYANSKEYSINIEGVWKLASTKPPKSDGTIIRSDSNWQMMKIYTKSHFVFSEQAPNRTKIVNGADEAELCKAAKGFFAGAGTYTIDSDSTYTEHIKIFLNPNYIDAKVTYKCKFISKNLWSQEGYLPAKSLGLADEDIHIYEVWERIE